MYLECDLFIPCLVQYICAPCFSGLCFEANKGSFRVSTWWEILRRYWNTSFTTQLQCPCLSAWLSWPRMVRRRSLSCCSLCSLSGSVYSRSPDTCWKNMEVNCSLLGKLKVSFGSVNYTSCSSWITYFSFSSGAFRVCFETAVHFLQKVSKNDLSV